MVNPAKKRSQAIRKEQLCTQKEEEKLRQAAIKASPAAWRAELKQKIPPKVSAGLESAFCKGFSVVFSQGLAVIEKSYHKETLQADHRIRDYAFQLKGGRKELKQLHKSARQRDLKNLAVTAVEGIGLGALGIGMPDIVLFLSAILRGIYETALHFGFEYESPREQLFILKMMEASLSAGESWAAANEAVNQMMTDDSAVTQAVLDAQIRRTASVFSDDMMLLKFIQGFPIVGILGGAANPVYYGKVLKYVQLKYRQRYLLQLNSPK